MLKSMVLLLIVMVIGTGCAVDQVFMENLTSSYGGAGTSGSSFVEKGAKITFKLRVECDADPESLQFYVLDPFAKYQVINKSLSMKRNEKNHVYHLSLPVGRIRLSSMTLRGGNVLPIEKIFEIFDYGTYDMGVISVNEDHNIELRTLRGQKIKSK